MTKSYLLRRLFSALLVLAAGAVNAQTVWNMAFPTDGAGSAGAETGRGICTDASGNVYTVGVFGNAATDFDLGGGSVTFPGVANNDGYIASYTKDGVFRWATIITSLGADFGSPSGAICTDGTYVWFTGVVNISGTPGVDAPRTITHTGATFFTTNMNASSNDAVVGKLNCSNGTTVWAKTFGGVGSPGSDNGLGICVDPGGNCYVVGAYTAAFTLDGVPAPATTGGTGRDLYIAKFSPSGLLKRIATGGATGADDVVANGAAICYVPGATPSIIAVGSYAGNAAPVYGTFNTGNTPSLTHDGGVHDAMLLELDTILGFTNALGIGSAGLDELLGATYDPFSGGVYVAGYFAGNATFPGTPALTSLGGEDIAIARYSVTSDAFVWSRNVGSPGNEKAFAITANGQGGILFSGSHASTASWTFGSSTVPITAGANDIIVGRYSPAGTAVWALSAGSATGDDARGVASYVQTTPYVQSVFITGNHQNGVVFSPGSPSNFTLTGDGGNDFYLARINDASLPLSATQSQVNLVCNGVCTGSATVVASGGTAPYTYSWAPSGGSGATASSLCAINYTVTITDAASTSITKTFSITQPLAIVITPISQTNVSCNGGSNGAAQVTASGGTGTLTYNWTPGNPTGDGTGSVSGLIAQVYTVTVTDANSCTATRTFNITQPPAITVTPVSQTNVACFGGSNGAASVSVSGGVPAYSYNWTPGNPPGDGSPSVTGLTAQVYTVTVTDANGCQGTRTFNITQPSAPVSGTTVVTNVACFGGSNGAINLTPSGGTGPYTFNWLPSGPTTEDRTGLTAGTYTVVITDANSCTGTVTVSVTQPTSPVSGTTVVTNVACFGGNNGAINLTPSGGTGPYTYNWLPSGPTTEDRTGLTAGTYTVVITDVNSCTGTVTVSVTQPTSPVSGTTVVTNVACFGGSNGSINLTPSGGTGPYTFNWLPSGPTTEDRTGLTAGTYTVVITDANSCTGTVTVSVTQPTSPVSGSTVVTNVACFGGSNGAINLTPSGGTGPYTFNWLPSGPTTEDRTGLVAGTYTVQITDVIGCTGTVTASVTQPASPVSGATVVTNVSCFGGSNGAINLTPSGGTGPYTYNWLPSGPTTEDRTGLVAGTYTVQITDVNGCTGTVTASVTQPTSPVSGSTVVTNVACFGGSNGAINLTPSGGTGPYTYNWLPSGPTTEDRTGLTAGTYTVVITDANGCTGTVTASVTQPASTISGSTVVTNVTCFGGSDGTINLTPSGGAGPYTFNWGGGITTEDRTGLAAGTYTVVITDANGCTGTATASVTQPAAPVSGSTVVTNISCNGGSNGAINLTPSGGTPGYTYNWGGGITTEDRTGLAAGTYTVIITDAVGCTGTVTATVTQPAVLAATGAQTNVLCNGGSTGSATVTVTGGTPAYSYSWAPSGGTAASASGLAAGNYTVTVTDANGCITTQTFNITQPAVLASTGAQTNVLCNGASTGSATVTVTGGTPAYSYSWAPSGGTAATASGLAAGNYTVTITDANGCTTTRSFNITQPTAIVSTGAQTNVLCNGGSTGSATVAVTGGTPSYSYSWAPSGGTAATASGLAAGSYTVTITDANGCLSSQTFNITQPASALASTGAQTNVACNGGSTGSATVTVTGGTPAYSYAWSPSGGTAATASGLAAGTYTATVTDANGCVATQTFSITEPAPLVVTSTQTDVSCNSACDGLANAAVTGGTAPYSYNWSNGATTSSITALCAGTYLVVVTDANGCQAPHTVIITQPAPLTASGTQVDALCNGQTGTATVNVTGGTPSYSYSWAPSGGTAATASGLTPGSYTCTITDANGCSTMQTFTITEPPALTIVGTQVNVSCNGGSDGVATVSVAGGTPVYTYAWTPSGGIAATANGLSAGTYTCTVTDANGCTITQTFNITEPPVLTLTFTITDATCNGACNGSASATASGGTGPVTYMWMPGGQTTQTVNGLCAGTYTCTVTDANGCTTTQSFSITQPAPLTVSAMQTNVSCNGGTNGSAMVMVAGGVAPYTYSWSSGGTTDTENNLAAGSYTCTITDQSGCTFTQTFSITEPPALQVIGTQTDVSCNGGNNGSADVTVSGGTPPYSYSWSSGGTTGAESNLAAGSYTVTITDANNCTFTQTFSITEPSALGLSGSVTAVACNSDTTGAIDITPNGGVSPYTFSWSNGATTEDISNIGAGSYTVTITDANSCTFTQTLSITEPPALAASTASTTNPSSCGTADGAADVDVTGGVAPYTFSWSNGATTEDLSGIAAGSYTLTVTDDNGCTTVHTIAINDPNAPAVTVSLSMDTICLADDTMMLTGASPAGGTWSGPGVSGNGFDPMSAGIGQHVITYTFTDTSGCTGTASDTITVDVCTGAATVIAKGNITLYPNPVDGELFLNLENFTGTTVVRLMNAEGRLLYEERLTPGSTTHRIDTSELAAGLYFVQVQAQGQAAVSKVVKR